MVPVYGDVCKIDSVGVLGVRRSVLELVSCRRDGHEWQWDTVELTIASSSSTYALLEGCIPDISVWRVGEECSFGRLLLYRNQMVLQCAGREYVLKALVLHIQCYI